MAASATSSISGARGARVVLAAPTGRAAKRLAELAGHEAATIHRLLALRPGGDPSFDADKPLDADLVVVDETSMVDVILANKLVKAIAPGAHLLLVGDGPLRAQLTEQVMLAGLEKAVTFTGAVPHHEVPAHVIAMDVAVAPYPALEESYYSPLKLFEYMAAGRAIVASRMGQIAEILVEGESGLLFDPGNLTQLADCLRRLRHSPALAQELGRKAREASGSYTWDHNAARLIEQVERLTGRRCNTSPLNQEGQEKEGQSVVRIGSSV